MTESEIARLAPAFARYLTHFHGCFVSPRTAAHFDTYCRGLLSDLPRKSVEPIAWQAHTAVRTLQEFLVTSRWDHLRARDLLQQRLAHPLPDLPTDDLGTIGVVDETSCRKWGDQTPGVQRQYLGCVGKIDHGIVTVHLAVTKGPFQALLDADLYLPEGWANDRARCERAGIPPETKYRPKWQLALAQLWRSLNHGVALDWLVFDEGYGSKVPFLQALNLLGQKFIGEVPVNFTVRGYAQGQASRADHWQPASRTESWRRFRLPRKTVADQVWRAKSTRVWVAEGWQVLVTAINERTGEVKYWVSNAVDESVGRLLRVAFRRATVEHAFRLAKQEAGLMHYEGRDYVGLMRHLILALVVLGFVAEQTERLRGEKSRGDGGAGVPRIERADGGVIPSTPRSVGNRPYEPSHLLPPTQEPTGHQITQETTT